MTNTLTLPVKFLYPERDVQPLPDAQLSLVNHIDIHLTEDLPAAPKGTSFKIPLGFALQLPNGFEAELKVRSSTFKKYGLILVNSVGVIDEEYGGPLDEWGATVYALEDFPGARAGDRLFQFKIQPNMHHVLHNLFDVDGITFSQEAFDDDFKNRGGFGSTGK